MDEGLGILHINTGREWGGGQQQTLYLFEALLGRGYRTALVCQPRSALGAVCREKGLPSAQLRILGEMDLASGFRIACYCRRHGYRMLHLHTAHDLALGMLAKLFSRSLTVIGVRRVPIPIKKHALSQLKYKGRYLNKMVCISENIRRVLLEGGVPEEKLVTIHSGVDIHRFDDTVVPAGFDHDWGIPKGHTVVGTVAALTGDKDYATFLHAAKRVATHMDAVTFVAVGGGGDRDRILRLRDELDLGNRVLFTGFQKDVGPFLKRFDIFTLAAKCEGLGTSILDAQALGLPVVACDAGGVPEIVIDRTNGLLVPPRDPDALAGAWLELIADDGLRRRLGREAKKKVRAFSIEETVIKNIRLYEALQA